MHEPKQRAQHSRIRRILTKMFLPISGVGLVIFSIFLARVVFVVREVSCSRDDGASCDDAVIAELSRLHGSFMFDLNTQSVESKLLAALPTVREVEFKKHAPSRLSVVLRIHKPAYYLLVRDKYYLVNEGGVVIEESDHLPAGFIEISLPTGIQNVEQDLDAQLFRALLTIQNEIKNLSLPVQKIQVINKNEIVLLLHTGIVGIVSSDDPATQLATLQRILNQATMVDEARRIDVRFSHPIIRNGGS